MDSPRSDDCFSIEALREDDPEDQTILWKAEILFIYLFINFSTAYLINTKNIYSGRTPQQRVANYCGP